jgi:hypothetical protein
MSISQNIPQYTSVVRAESEARMYRWKTAWWGRIFVDTECLNGDLYRKWEKMGVLKEMLRFDGKIKTDGRSDNWWRVVEFHRV